MAVPMKLVVAAFLMTSLFAMIAGKPMRKPQKMAELTHLLRRDFPYYPGHLKFKLTTVFNGMLPPRNETYVLSKNFQTSEHGGTHYDAPVHFCKTCAHTQDVPIERLVGAGVIINVKEKAANNPNYVVTVDDLKAWEEKHGEIPKGAHVIMNSGWYKFVNNATKFVGTNNTNTSSLHFPSFAPLAAKWLLDERDISALGVDTLSIDAGESQRFLVHRQILTRGRIGLENVNNLDAIPEAGATIYAFPIYIKDGTGGPTRIIAMWDSAPIGHLANSFFIIFMAIIVCLL